MGDHQWLQLSRQLLLRRYDKVRVTRSLDAFPCDDWLQLHNHIFLIASIVTYLPPRPPCPLYRYKFLGRGWRLAVLLRVLVGVSGSLPLFRLAPLSGPSCLVLRLLLFQNVVPWRMNAYIIHPCLQR